jgi:phage terminase Nu1 subunit (DNA packaging protein)
MPKTTVQHRGITLEVEYDYQPAERQTLEYPGCPEDACVNTVTHLGDEITFLFLGDDKTLNRRGEELTETLLDHIRTDRQAALSDQAYKDFREKQLMRREVAL